MHNSIDKEHKDTKLICRYDVQVLEVFGFPLRHYKTQPASY
jgi:hypothetical protein